MRASFYFFAAALLAPIVMSACGGVVAPDGGGGKTEPTTTPTTTGTGTGTAPTTTGTTEPPPPPKCTETKDHVDISVDGAGHADSCVAMGDRSPERSYDVVGQIVLTHPQDVEIETCAPTADCTGDTRVHLHVGAPELDLDLVPVGSFVSAHLSFAKPWSCVISVSMHSIDTWGGVTNPVDGGGHLYLEAVDGAPGAAAGALKVAPVAQHCKAPGGPSCGGSGFAPDDYALQFFTGVGGGDGQTAQMGETRWPIFMPGGDTIRVRDVRSFESGLCDDSWNWAFWAIRDVAVPD
jgi:hypothetical protein